MPPKGKVRKKPAPKEPVSGYLKLRDEEKQKRSEPPEIEPKQETKKRPSKASRRRRGMI